MIRLYRRLYVCLVYCAVISFSSSILADEVPASKNFGPPPPPFKPSIPIALVGGTLIDGTGSAAKTGYTVLIEGHQIKAVGPSPQIAVPSDAQVINASGMTIMPGLVNSNEHVQLNPLYPAPAADLPIADLRARWERNFARMPQMAYTYLMQGVTMIRQTSGPLKRLVPIKADIDQGKLPGPRIMLGGALLMSPQHFAHYTQKNRTPAEAVNWLRDDFAYRILNDIDKDTDALLGPEIEYWKILFSDEPFDGKNDFTDEQVKFIIDKAHRHGKRIDIHVNASSTDGYRRMLKFDINTIEHPFDGNFLIDEDIIAGYQKKGIVAASLLRGRVQGVEHAMDPHLFDETKFIMSMDPDEYRMLMRYRDKMVFNKLNPTQRGLSVYDKRNSQSDMFGQDGPSFEDQMKSRETSRENMRRFIKAGVKLSMGTDTASFLNFIQDDPAAMEMGYMVEMGMSPMDVIVASTRNGAEIVGLQDKLGTIEAGKLADVIVVAGDPLTDMSVMKRVAVVIKDGVRYK